MCLAPIHDKFGLRLTLKTNSGQNFGNNIRPPVVGNRWWGHDPAVANISSCLNTLRPRQDGHYFADDVLKCIFLNENVWISPKISLKFVPNGPINKIPALDQIMAWRRPGDKPLSEPMLVFVPTHICGTRPQWVNVSPWSKNNYFHGH